MRRLQIKHLTVYEYVKKVEFLPHKLLLRPREGHDIRIESSLLDITDEFVRLANKHGSSGSGVEKQPNIPDKYIVLQIVIFYCFAKKNITI